MSIEDALSIAYEDGFIPAPSPDLETIEISTTDNFDNIPLINEEIEGDILNDLSLNNNVIDGEGLDWAPLPVEVACDILEPTTDSPDVIHMCQFCKFLFLTENELNEHNCQKKPRIKVKQFDKPAAPGFRTLRKSSKGNKDIKNKDEQSQRTRNDPGSWVCQVCNKSLSRQSGLMIHMRRHTGEMPYECGYCKKKFVVLYDLDRHTLTHRGKKRKYSYNCSACRKPFVTLSGLMQHRRRFHMTCTEHCCDVCGQTFTLKSNLNMHKIVHETENTMLEIMESTPSNTLLVLYEDDLT